MCAVCVCVYCMCVLGSFSWISSTKTNIAVENFNPFIPRTTHNIHGITLTFIRSTFHVRLPTSLESTEQQKKDYKIRGERGRVNEQKRVK